VGEGTSWRHARDYRLVRRRLPASLPWGDVDPYITPVRVPLERIVSRVGFSHARDGWHPFVEAIREYEADRALRFEDSTLARLYERYRPANVHEVLLDHLATPLEPFCDWPPVVNLVRWVWAHNRHSVARILRESDAAGPDRAWTHYGPHTREYGERELARIVSTYESIRGGGFDAAAYEARRMDGYFLTRGEEYRFVLLHGNHRVAALNVLGYEHVDVHARRFHPAVVDEGELQRWTVAGGGLYSGELVTNLFDMLFTETGRKKARRHGLV
jgi:hypothetical protein